MKHVLLLGGTGTISLAIAKLAAGMGWQVTVLNRGNHNQWLGDTNIIIADVRDKAQMEEALFGQHFDAVCDFLTYTKEQALQNIALFQNKTNQYIFISSATVYQKPPSHYLIKEDMPKGNPFSPYAQNKILCEQAFLEAYNASGFPITIVRPSYTYGDRSIPWALNARSMRYSFIHRIKSGKPIVIPGDGTNFFTITHNTDFAMGFMGILGDNRAIGQDFHITGDEALTWDGALNIIQDYLNIEAKVCHIASEAICTIMPLEGASLMGDKAQTAIFDNSKIKGFAPDYKTNTPFAKGIASTLNYYHTHSEMMGYDLEWDAQIDALINKFGY